MWFGTFSSLGARMWTHGLVHPLFVGQTTWISNFCDKKEKLLGHGVEDHDVCDGNDVEVCYSLVKHPCGVLSHLYQRVCASWEMWVGYDRVAC